MAPSRLNLPNIITVARIAACPAIFALALTPTVSARLTAFVLFVMAGLSDLWDGYLARKRGLITDLGKLLDPIADKLLLVATFVPFLILSHRPGGMWELPWWGPLPIWVVIVIFGRELAITAFRSYAARKGVVIAAGKSGKYKAFIQSLFIGGLLLWYPLKMLSLSEAWGGWFWTAWTAVHGAWIGVTLAAAVVLTVYSMIDYLWTYRSVGRAGS